MHASAGRCTRAPRKEAWPSACAVPFPRPGRRVRLAARRVRMRQHVHSGGADRQCGTCWRGLGGTLTAAMGAFGTALGVEPPSAGRLARSHAARLVCACLGPLGRAPLREPPGATPFAHGRAHEGLRQSSHTSSVPVCALYQCSAVQCSAVQCSAVQCSAVQCSAVQCSAVQCVSNPPPGARRGDGRRGPGGGGHGASGLGVRGEGASRWKLMEADGRCRKRKRRTAVRP